MSIVTKQELYSYFERGDKPTAEEFRNLIDTLYKSGRTIIGTQNNDTQLVLDDGSMIQLGGSSSDTRNLKQLLIDRINA